MSVLDEFNAKMAKIPEDKRPRVLPPISLLENLDEIRLHLSTATDAMHHLLRMLGEH